MTTMMDGTVSVDPTTGVETVVEGFDNTWEMIGTIENTEEETRETVVDDVNQTLNNSDDVQANADMDMMGMMNINMIYFAIAVFVCLFIGAEYRSGYVKRLFTHKSKRNDYVVSKTVVLTIGSSLLVIAFFIGSMLGGKFAGLPFTMIGFTKFNVVMCILSKCILSSIFVALSILMSVIGKDKVWLSLIISLCMSMFLFMMIPMLSPLTSTIANVGFSFVGGIIFSIAIGTISNLILKKKSIL